MLITPPSPRPTNALQDHNKSRSAHSGGVNSLGKSMKSNDKATVLLRHEEHGQSWPHSGWSPWVPWLLTYGSLLCMEPRFAPSLLPMPPLNTWGNCARRAGKLYKAHSRLYRRQNLRINSTKYSLESSRRDLHNALLCTVLESVI